jgi:chitinase
MRIRRRLAVLGAAALLAPPPARAEGPAIIAYVFPQDRVIEPAEIAADELTHVNYAFANIRDGRVVEGFEKDALNLRALTALRRDQPRLKVLVSVGGWTWSGGFSDAALTPESRRVFVESAVDLVRRHDLDGVDIDWEYPGQRGFGNTYRPQDKTSFTALMADLRGALDAAGASSHRRYLLTLAAGASRQFLANTEMDKVQASVDFVNLMAYDFREAESDPLAGHHANLYPSPLDPDQGSADQAVSDFFAAGVPAAKLVLGVPFYGRAWADVEAKGDGLYQRGSASKERIDTRYASLAAERVNRAGYRRVWDRRAQAAFLWNPATRSFISYEDPESLAAKSRYVLDHGLGGVMFWEYYSDPTGTLLRTLYRELTRHRSGP